MNWSSSFLFLYFLLLLVALLSVVFSSTLALACLAAPFLFSIYLPFSSNLVTLEIEREGEQVYFGFILQMIFIDLLVRRVQFLDT